MSFINKFIEDTDTPEPVKRLFRHFVSEFENQDSIDWNKQIKQTTSEFHRKTLLKQGRCEFDNPPLNLTSEELIVLYNYYYFPMHFQSSYEIYKKLFEEQEEFQNQTFFFHDFGCGTLSSTLAFSACYSKGISNSSTFKYFNQLDSFNKFNSYYFENGEINFFCNSEFIMEHQIESSEVPDLIVGYWLNDISKVILTYIINFIKNDSYNGNFSHDYFFNYAKTIQGRYSIPVIADKFYIGEFQSPHVVSSNIEPFKSFCNSQHKSTNEITVILNFSYVLASESIDVQNIESIIEEYQKTGCKLIIVNQNPDLDNLNKKWEQLKNKIKFVKSIKGLQPIKHFGPKSKSRFEVVFPTNIDNFLTNIEKMFEEFDNLYNEKKYNSLDNLLADYFKSNHYNPLLHVIEMDRLNKTKYFNMCNYILDFQYSINKISKWGYYQQKAILYRKINSITIANSFYELYCYYKKIDFMNRYEDNLPF